PSAVHAVAAVCCAAGRLPITELANDLCLSQDASVKRFGRAIGISPKPIGDIVRLKALIDAYRPEWSIHRLALERGHVHHAQFTRAFKRFTGLSPRLFFSQSHFW